VSPPGRGLQDWLKTSVLGETRAAADGPKSEDPAAEALFTRYEYLRDIGVGGVGSVHCVKDRNLLRQVALKVLDPALAENPAQCERFIHEAQINAQLEHPNIVPVHEMVAPAVGPKYFTMKLVEGLNLQDWIQNAGRPAGVPEVLHDMLAAVVKVCDALALAHSRGVLHCDLKPANIMVGSFGEVYLMDWGLARLRPEEGESGGGIELSRSKESQLSNAGKVLGTPAFMSPEQAAGEDEHYSERTDVFGMGAVLYSILTGEPPWGTGPVAEVLARARACQLVFPPLSPLQLPPRLCRIAARAMALEPGDRYPSVVAMKDELQAFLRGSFRFPTREYRAGTAIVAEGERGDEAFVIESGTCVVYKTVDGERKVRRHLGPGSVFGEAAVFTGGVRTATVQAVDEVIVRVVTRELLEENLGLDTWFGAFVFALADRFRELEEQVAHTLPVVGARE
jgi:serine/threonine-protein kinase